MNKLALAPMTLVDVPPLEYIDAAFRAGYDAIGIRLYRSPGLWYGFHPVVGDKQLEHEVKAAIAASGLEMVDILSFYLQPDFDLDPMLGPLAFGAELGAKYALVIGADPEWDRMVENFRRFCDAAAAVGLTAAIETPVNGRALDSLPRVLKLIDDAGRPNAVCCLDPHQFYRAGHEPEMLRGVDARLLPYTQITDGLNDAGNREPRLIGEGAVPLHAILDILPHDIMLSVECAMPRDAAYTPAEWAQRAIDSTRTFLEGYYAAK